MKKLLSVLLASLMVLSLLAACGSGGNNGGQNAQAPSGGDTQAPDNTGGDAEPAGDVTIQVAALASG